MNNHHIASLLAEQHTAELRRAAHQRPPRVGWFDVAPVLSLLGAVAVLLAVAGPSL